MHVCVCVCVCVCVSECVCKTIHTCTNGDKNHLKI